MYSKREGKCVSCILNIIIKTGIILSDEAVIIPSVLKQFCSVLYKFNLHTTDIILLSLIDIYAKSLLLVYYIMAMLKCISWSSVLDLYLHVCVLNDFNRCTTCML